MSRILVVNDSVSVLGALERTLLKSGHEVFCEKSGGNALEKLESSGADLVVCDIELADIDGYEVCRKISEREQKVPTILMSGLVDVAVEDRAFDVGAHCVLRKPFSQDQICSAVRLALETAERSNGSSPPESLEQGPLGEERRLIVRELLLPFEQVKSLRLAAVVDSDGEAVAATSSHGGTESISFLPAGRDIYRFFWLAAATSERLDKGPPATVILEGPDGLVLFQALHCRWLLVVVGDPKAPMGEVRLLARRFCNDLEESFKAPSTAPS